MVSRVVGFSKIKTFYSKTLEHGGLLHAYLFTGQEQIGKRLFALELAEELTGSTALRLYSSIASPDVLIVDPADSESGHSISIEEIRKIKNFLTLHAQGLRKVIVINDAHTMTDEAQNGLLKMLEEPSPTTVFILVTAYRDQLLSTVLSRCQEVAFPDHPRASFEKIWGDAKLSDAQKDFLFAFSHGRLGLVIDILKNNSIGDIKKSAEEFSSLASADLNDRFVAARALAEEKDHAILNTKVLYWMLYMGTRPRDQKNSRALRGLLTLHTVLSQPQYNTQMALEEFFLKL